jgi:hypothetical protein
MEATSSGSHPARRISSAPASTRCQRPGARAAGTRRSSGAAGRRRIPPGPGRGHAGNALLAPAADAGDAGFGQSWHLAGVPAGADPAADSTVQRDPCPCGRVGQAHAEWVGWRVGTSAGSAADMYSCEMSTLGNGIRMHCPAYSFAIDRPHRERRAECSVLSSCAAARLFWMGSASEYRARWLAALAGTGGVMVRILLRRWRWSSWPRAWRNRRP